MLLAIGFWPLAKPNRQHLITPVIEAFTASRQQPAAVIANHSFYSNYRRVQLELKGCSSGGTIKQAQRCCRSY